MTTQQRLFKLANELSGEDLESIDARDVLRIFANELELTANDLDLIKEELWTSQQP